ncbi:hypothetical protein [Agrobacterium sp. fls2-241-TYG-188a]|uniref:hypothetical protein n=1 Tax=Agrobacterium sp. fls2-241-TYG-188a TaxID=3040275 RepID=UPI00254DD1E8|nr:hypothetical protein [Agrobacterium sp. fls2-241-TYG-188a]
MAFETDASGRLALGGIHDSVIADLTLSGATKTLLFRLNSEGVTTIIKTSSLHMLNMSGLWEGSIVSNVFVWDFNRVPDRYISDSEVGWSHLFEGRISDRAEVDAQIARYQSRMSTGKLVSIGCSYGGNISFLCEDALIEQQSDGRKEERIQSLNRTV